MNGAAGRYRILALDVDGTLLDADGHLRPRTADAVARAARAGIRPVLCTGRRYRRARAVTEQLADQLVIMNRHRFASLRRAPPTVVRKWTKDEIVVRALLDRTFALVTEGSFDPSLPGIPPGLRYWAVFAKA